MQPDERLRAAADLFQERSKLYGNVALDTIGHVLHELFPEGLNLQTPEDFARAFHVFMLANKLARYTVRWREGGHEDSLVDLSVYAQMLATVDEGEW